MNKHFNRKLFQGSHKKTDKTYFEGWYFRQTNQDGVSISFIPGISYNKDNPHCFIQCIVHQQDKVVAHYFRYPIESFQYDKDNLAVTIDRSIFEGHQVTVDLEDEDTIIKGTLYLGVHDPIVQSNICPNIMGPLSYIPNLECNHDIISMGHHISGEIDYNGDIIDMTDGNGYLEKDWGKSFPRKYSWFQSNFFKESSVKMIGAIADVPVGPIEIRGFFCVLTIDNKEYRFTTYKGSRLKIVRSTEESLDMIMYNKKEKLYIKCEMSTNQELVAPNKNGMDYTIKEGLGGKIHIRLKDRKGNLIYKGTGENAGLELSAERLE